MKRLQKQNMKASNIEILWGQTIPLCEEQTEVITQWESSTVALKQALLNQQQADNPILAAHCEGSSADYEISSE